MKMGTKYVWIGCVSLLIGLVIGFLTQSLIHRNSKWIPEDDNGNILPISLRPLQEEAVVKLFREGLKAADQKSTESQNLSDIRIQATWKCQTEAPLLAPILWKNYHVYIYDSNNKFSAEDRFLHLSGYLDKIDEALSGCRTEEEFQQVWAVRCQVIRERDKEQKEIDKNTVQKITKLVQKMTEANNSKEFIKTIKSFAQETVEIKPAIALAISSIPEDEYKSSEIVQSGNKLIQLVSYAAKAQCAFLKKERDQAIKDDRDNKAVAPESLNLQNNENTASGQNPGAGQYELLQTELNDFALELEKCDLPTWYTMLEETKSAPQDNETKSKKVDNADSNGSILIDLQNDMEQLRSDAIRLQGMRYNLWALRSIHQADESANWVNILNKINVGLLHPTVSALYSSASDKLIKEKTDPNTRVRVVSSILNERKIPLSEF